MSTEGTGPLTRRSPYGLWCFCILAARLHLVLLTRNLQSHGTKYPFNLKICCPLCSCHFSVHTSTPLTSSFHFNQLSIGFFHWDHQEFSSYPSRSSATLFLRIIYSKSTPNTSRSECNSAWVMFFYAEKIYFICSRSIKHLLMM